MAAALLTRSLLIACCVTLLVSCATPPERELSTQRNRYATLPNGHDPLHPEQLVQGHEHNGDIARIGSIRYFEKELGRPLNILEISGGGQNGAFGAGVLKGWTETGARPRFDIVTGVSTGALTATHAFLGTPADDEVLERLFTNVDKSDIYVRRNILFEILLGGESVVSTEPLRQLIASVITKEVLQRVAAEYKKHRSLWVGTTNLDYSQTWAWNLSAIAAEGGPEALELYRSILLASASPPAVFPPVEIEGHLFADGMVRANLLVAGLSGQHKPPPPPYGPGTIWVIINGKGEAVPKAIPNNVLNVSAASLGQMMDGFTNALMLRSFIAARAHGYHFRLLEIPPDTAIGSNPLAFNPEQMRAGFDAGYALGRDPNSWSKKPHASGDVPRWASQGF